MRSPSPTAVKICGITQLQQAKAIAALGVKAIGVIGVPSSKRFVKEPARRAIFSELTNDFPKLKRVWVVANLDELSLKNALEGEGTPSIIQLHGSENQENCALLRRKYSMIEWWKAISIKSKDDIQLANSYLGTVDAVLLDAWDKGLLGGTGKRLPLKWLKESTIKLPWWLAGGISAEWIPKVLSEVNPYGFDASSRLEISPGIKDLKKVNSLLEAIKSSSEN